MSQSQDNILKGTFWVKVAPTQKKAQNFCAHPKNQKLADFFGVFLAHRKIIRVVEGCRRIKTSRYLHTKKAFKTSARPGQPAGAKNKIKRQYSEGQLFGSKFAPTQKKEDFISPSNARKELENCLEVFLSGKFPHFFLATL